jgi:nicotinic acid phosphoribosyltransferase
MAHSYVLSFESEEQAFEAFTRDNPDDALLLVDTYETLEGGTPCDRSLATDRDPAERDPDRLGRSRRPRP